MGLIVYPRPSRYPSRNKNDFEYKPYFIRCILYAEYFCDFIVVQYVYNRQMYIWKPSSIYIDENLRINNGDVVASNCLLWLYFTAARTLMSQNSRNIMYKWRDACTVGLVKNIAEIATYITDIIINNNIIR